MKVVEKKRAPKKKSTKAEFNPTPDQVQAAARQSMRVLDKAVSDGRSLKIYLDGD